jgi:hypothetical protein
MDNQEWLKNLKAGDPAAISGYDLDHYYSVTVKNVTPTGRITVVDKRGTETKFDSHGRQMNADRWHPNFLSPITPEMQATRRRKNLIHQIQETKWSNLNLEQLEQVDSLVKGFLSPKENEST